MIELTNLSKEFGMGFWNGISGLVTQPLKGAQKEGGAGFIKGIGRGIAGVVVKPGAGIYGLPGYAMQGIYKEVQKHFGKSVENYIIAARTAQGWEAWLALDKDEQMEIVHRYLKLVDEVKRKKVVGEDSMEAVQGFIDTTKERRRERWAKINVKKEQISGEFRGKKQRWQDRVHSNRSDSSSSGTGWQQSTAGKSTSELLKDGYRADLANTSIGKGISMHDNTLNPVNSAGHLQHSATAPDEQMHYHDSDEEDYQHDDDFERALQESIKQTSLGNADEDRDIDKAIRASIAHLQRTITRPETNVVKDDDAEDEQLKLAIAESLKSSGGGGALGEQETGTLQPPAIPPRSPRRGRSPHAALQQAVKNAPDTEPGGSSLEADAHTAVERRDADDAELKKALDESQKMIDDEAKAKREEEIVLEYVKKQSLMEENYRRSIGQKDGAGGGEASGTS